nr:MAG TPA: hypothetical protein [Caudoviricetes sp.]
MLGVKHYHLKVLRFDTEYIFGVHDFNILITYKMKILNLF